NTDGGSRAPEKEGEGLLPPREAPATPPATADAKSRSASDGAGGASSPESALDVTPAAGTGPQPNGVAAKGSDAATVDVTVTDEPVQTATTTGTGAFRIQLAAVKTPDAAQAAWKKMAKAYPEVLKGLALNVVK